eukprot:TRINITY_DN4075_c0_g1_i1.p1 TRINITY_DN4075_c0_g1~~TRINITY_DN4075_c0_g1_i1.p1  ORF type:complete len:721 (+),score=234.81 TRINITY_DN4075_c0_g1_i1:104-2266(+)
MAARAAGPGQRVHGLLWALVLVFGAASADGAKVAASSASAARLSRLVVARDGSASLLLELLQGLRQETQAGVRLAGASAKWCRNTMGQRKAMKEALQRQLSEAEAARRQLAADEDRLGGEKGLLNSTVDEQEKRLKEAGELVSFASKEFAAQKEELLQTLDAAATAIRLLRAQQADSSNAGNAGSNQALEASLSQLSSEQLSDSETQTVSSFLQSGGSKSEDLLQMLLNLRNRLEEDKADAEAEHKMMTHKLRAFADRLNSSILDGRTQAATVKTEAAQRKRERARLERKSWDLKELLKAADSSSQTIQAACIELKRQKEAEAAQITSESGAVKSMLKNLPRGSWLAEGTPELAAPSFLQVNEAPSAVSASLISHAVGELQTLAEKYPDEASWYEESAKKLSAAYSSTGKAGSRDEASVASSNATEDESGDSSNALRDIQQFVLTEAAPSDIASDPALNDADARQVKSIQDTYRNLLKHLKQEEGKTTTERTWCKNLLQSAASDRQALKRSLKQVDAKLHMMDGAIADTEHSSKFNQEMYEALQEQSKQLHVLAAEAEHQQDRFMTLLNSRARQLNDGINADLGQNDPKTSQMASELMRIMGQHEALLQKQHSKAPELTKAVLGADGRVLALLEGDRKQDRLRMLRLKSERELLASQSRTRASALGNGAGQKDELDSAAAAAAAFCSQNNPEQARASLLQAEERQLKADLAATGADSEEA